LQEKQLSEYQSFENSETNLFGNKELNYFLKSRKDILCAMLNILFDELKKFIFPEI
jgi:hypothetical protein